MVISDIYLDLQYKQGLVEVPYIVAQTIIFGIITYFMINFERTISKILSLFSSVLLLLLLLLLVVH